MDKLVSNANTVQSLLSLRIDDSTSLRTTLNILHKHQFERYVFACGTSKTVIDSWRQTSDVLENKGYQFIRVYSLTSN